MARAGSRSSIDTPVSNPLGTPFVATDVTWVFMDRPRAAWVGLSKGQSKAPLFLAD